MRTFPLWLLACQLMTVSGAFANEDALQRGAHVVAEVCNGCHSLKYIKYRDFLQLGFTKEEVTVLRGGRALGDPLVAQMAPANAQAAFDIVPPDLSLMVNAREGGADYIYDLLTGFYTDSSGNTANHVFPGVKMPDILGISQADQAKREVIQNKARDAVTFLAWAADPQSEERERMGRFVLGYVLLLTVLLYFLKRKIWSRLEY